MKLNKKDIQTISKILYKNDPQGLAKLGAPKDEYNSEAKMILKFMQAAGVWDWHAVQILAWAIFAQAFSIKEAGELGNYVGIGRDIHNADLNLYKDWYSK